MTRPNITLNMWSTITIIFLTLVGILIFRPELYNVLLNGIITILNSIPSIEIPMLG